MSQKQPETPIHHEVGIPILCQLLTKRKVARKRMANHKWYNQLPDDARESCVIFAKNLAVGKEKEV